VLDAKKQAIEVKASAEEKYTTMIHEEMKQTVWKSGGCKVMTQIEKNIIKNFHMKSYYNLTYANLIGRGFKSSNAREIAFEMINLEYIKGYFDQLVKVLS
jgi:hypothetical protein